MGDRHENPSRGRSKRCRPVWTALGAVVGAVLLLSGSGCAGGGKSLGGRDGIGDLHLFAMPAALDLDKVAGADGIGVRVYASAPGVARGIAIRQGVLEVVMFDGVVKDADIRAATPLKTWRFEPSALRPFEAETSLGIGYQIALRWGAERPRGSVVTVVARYRGVSGTVLWSTTNSISVGPV